MTGFGVRFGRNASSGTFLLAAVIALGALPGAAWAQGRIAGSVTDAATGAPLAAVLVEATNAQDAVAARTTTGPGGTYVLDGIAAGAYSVRFVSPGWTTVVMESQSVTSGQTTTVSATMEERAYEINPLTVTTSRTFEKALDAPAAVEVVSTRDLEERQVTSPVEHVEHQPGVNVGRTGIRGRTAVLRGFNNIFSGRTLFMTDNRIARVPSLRVNIFYLNPTSELDMERVETVLGPGSALYGPNAAGGVVHYMTKSPIRSPGATFSVGGGLRQQGDDGGIGSGPIQGGDAGLFQFDGRIAVAPSDKFGFKISGQYFDATEYAFTDLVEAQVAGAGQACIGAGFNPTSPACGPFTSGLDLTNPADQGVLAQSARNAAMGRDDGHRNWGVDARMDFEPSPGTSLVLAAGRNVAAQATELTGLGASNVTNWGVTYGQARLRHRDLFAQLFYNYNTNDETFLLRNGRPLFDNSSLLVGQLQYQSRIGSAHRLVYGVDYLGTNPDSKGTINGQFENDDQTTEIGGYVQWEWALSPKFDLTGAFRYDYNSSLADPVFSPRAALVFKPDASNSFRLTFNRAFSTPTSTNQFLDISGGTIPITGTPFFYDLRATGSGGNGYSYMRENGIPMHMSPFSALRGGSPREFLPTTTAQLWATAVDLIGALLPQAAPLVPLIPVPSADQVGVLALLLDTEVAGGGAPPPGCVAPPFCEAVDLANLQDIEALGPTVSNTFEFGYKGVFGDNVSVGANAWFTRYDSYIAPLRLLSPHVFLNGPQLGTYLSGVFRQLVGVAFATEAEALGTAAFIADQAAQIPLGTVTPTSVGGTASALALGYQDAGGFDVMGGELGAGFLLSDQLEMATSLSFIDRNTFETAGELLSEVSLNTPTVRGAASLTYRNDDSGVNGGLRFRAQNGFPFNSGPWVGDLAAITTLDANFGFRIPGYEDLWFQVDVSNVFDKAYQSMLGAPAIGRVVLARMRWDFNPF
ncbi:TonB-dependent receptor [Candidatus Palauibacter polyketidifaciens]|uniref:TonB-dependent receptor n=1 Tax=Candidatus Palauibacter polyketidifaciens TaxID=3056740 RepID=UPI0023869409|nr:TonB-dependent receptor [Candidatus Palauibacter polyketidifaciens]MDE2720876.1 TonB-dependent receptor [Candidatus Palauibacter polyketidifaciens]